MSGEKPPQYVRLLLKRICSDYNESISLPVPYKYLYGNPVHPVVPLDIAQDAVFIVGAYPTARFAIISGLRDVPVADISGPFSNERYFDGSTIRTERSYPNGTHYRT